MQGFYEDQGVRFMYPHTWELEVSEDGPRSLVAVNEPGGTAFAMISLDASGPAPSDVADEALEAIRVDYPELDSYPSLEEIDGFHAIGHIAGDGDEIDGSHGLPGAQTTVFGNHCSG